jgi:hypothetical protein
MRSDFNPALITTLIVVLLSQLISNIVICGGATAAQLHLLLELLFRQPMRFDDFPVAFRIELHREKNSPLLLIRLRIRIQDCSIGVRPLTHF